MGHGKTTAVLQRPVQDRMVGGVSQSESQYRRTGGDMCSLWRTAAGEAKRPKILQSVLLPVGDGPDTCGRDLPVVRPADRHHHWGGADLLQPGMRGGRPVCFAGISQRQSPNQCRRYPAMAGKADTGRQSEQKRSTWEASPSCMRNDQHVHRPGWIDRNHPLSFAV